MKTIAAAVGAIALLTAPVLAQDTTPTGGTQQNEPGTGGTSKPGVKGDPGGKSGPAANDAGTEPSSSGSATSGTDGAAGSDNSKVPGQPGNKSGPAQKPSK